MIPEPTQEDRNRDAFTDYSRVSSYGQTSPQGRIAAEIILPWIRRAVAAEARAIKWERLHDHRTEQLKAKDAELEQLRAENRRLRDGHWVWQGDGEDHLESLVCNILISPVQLREITAETDRLRAVNASLADRVAAQSELLTKRAEKNAN